jgi:hypothetical protein
MRDPRSNPYPVWGAPAIRSGPFGRTVAHTLLWGLRFFNPDRR